MMRFLFTLSLSMALSFSLAATAQHKPTTIEQLTVLNLIKALPEVVTFNKQMLKQNGRPLIIVLESKPRKADPFYTVSVSEDLIDRSFTYWRFCVSQQTKAVSYYDLIASKKTPLKTWRRLGRKW